MMQEAKPLLLNGVLRWWCSGDNCCSARVSVDHDFLCPEAGFLRNLIVTKK